MKFTMGKPKQTKPPYPSKYQLSDFQIAGLDWAYDNRGGHRAAVMNACAGSGKSTEIEMICNYTHEFYESILVCCFNTDIAKVMRPKLQHLRNVQVKTYHAVGRSAIFNSYKPTIDEEGVKVENLVKQRMNGTSKRFMLPSIKRLVGLCKSNVIPDPTDEELAICCIDFEIETFDDQPGVRYEIFDHVRKALTDSIDTVSTVIDFDDMIFLPVVLGLQPDQHSFILCDEFQDTNQAQAKLIHMARVGNLLGAGDRNQSIYAFRGADSRAMQRLIDEFDADELPLSISYRCPTAVRDLVNKEFPYIPFQTPEWAKEGSVTNDDIDKCIKAMQPGDMVLSRINAALPPICLSLIRDGKTARILGKDFGKMLAKMIEKQNAYDLPDLFQKLGEYRDKQYMKYVSLQVPDKISELDDKIETIIALSDGANSPWDVIARCNTLFAKDAEGVNLGTVHKEKGKEAKNVFIVRPDLLPLPFVMQKGNEEARTQELNGRYVAVTRSLENLTFCQGEL